MKDSKNPALLIALYKLMSNNKELDILNSNKIEHSGKIETSNIHVVDEDTKNMLNELRNNND